MDISFVESESMDAKVKIVKSMVASEVSEADVLKALSLTNNNVPEAVDIILDSPALCSLQPHLAVHKTLTSTGGTRVQVNLSKNLGEGVEESEGVAVDGLNVEKQDLVSVGNDEVTCGLEGESDGGVVEKCGGGIGLMEAVRVKEEIDEGFVEAEFSAEEKRDLSGEKYVEVKQEITNTAEAEIRVTEEPNTGIHDSIGALNQESLSVESGAIAVPIEGEREGSVLKKCDVGVEATEVVKVKEEPDVGFEAMEVVKVKEEPDVGFVEGGVLGDEKKDSSGGERSLVLVGKVEDSINLKCPETREEAKQEISSSVMAEIQVKEEAEVEVTSVLKVKEEPGLNVVNRSAIVVKEDVKPLASVQPLSARQLSYDEYIRMQMGCNKPKVKKVRTEEMALSSVVIEDGDFPEEPGWMLVGRTVITGLSTTKGRKLENNEIVHFTFPSPSTRTKISTHFMSSRAANASSSIVRFSTKRYGEVYIST